MAQEPRPSVNATLESLTGDECLELLATASVGRIGFVVDGKPEILPVNYVVEGGGVVVRVAAGSVLNQVALQVVAFEVDRIDDATRTGWSVLVQGVAQDVSEAVDTMSERLRTLALVSWAPGERHRWFRIRIDTVTGRRLVARR